MVKWKGIHRLGAAVVCWGALASAPTAWSAEPATKATDSKPAAAKSAASDVVLSKGGALTGVVVDGQGKRVDGAVVSIHQGSKQIARVVSDRNGAFEITGMRGGVYQIKAGDGAGTYRVWTASAAPPSARTAAVVVSTPQVVRGQAGGSGVVGAVGAGLGAAGLGVAGYAATQNNQTQDEVDDLQQSNQQLQQQLNQANINVGNLQQQLNQLNSSPP